MSGISAAQIQFAPTTICRAVNFGCSLGAASAPSRPPDEGRAADARFFLRHRRGELRRVDDVLNRAGIRRVEEVGETAFDERRNRLASCWPLSGTRMLDVGRLPSDRGQTR